MNRVELAALEEHRHQGVRERHEERRRGDRYEEREAHPYA